MIPTYTEKQHYENQAFHYANTAILLKCDASVHVEAFEDAVFWEMTFTHFVSDKKFNFIWGSNSLKANNTSGSAQCLKYKNYLSKRFFICIDSDYRYLLKETDISPSNLIFQTYTYSIENHLCYAAKLNKISEKCTRFNNNVFDFEAFLSAFSNAVYETFLWHLYFMKFKEEKKFPKDEFLKVIYLQQVITNHDIDNNGIAIINELTKRCKLKIDSLKIKYPEFNFETEKIYFKKLGLTNENTYLYIRGHNIFDLIVKIGNQVNYKLLNIEKQKLTGNVKAIEYLYKNVTPFKRELERIIIFEGYKEMETLKNDILTIMC